MSQSRIQIVYSGEILPHGTPASAIANFASLFKVDHPTARRIVTGRACILKKNLDQATAKKYAAVLMKAGLKVRIEAMASPPAGSAPHPQHPGPGQDRGSQERPEESATGEAPAHPEPPSPKREVDGASAPQRKPFIFNGSGTEYFKIWLVNIILSILTLGIYSAWAKVRSKQYFYGNTRIDGTSFQYLADPVKILKGRLIVAAVVITTSLLTEFVPLAGALVSLLVLLILPWVVVRALAFNARNSSLRSIRFGFDAKVWDAAKAFIFWPLLAVLTLGLLTPFIYFKQKKFIVEHSSYGTTKFRFSATAGDYYKIFLLLSLFVIIGLAVAALIATVFPPVAVLVGVGLYLYIFAYVTTRTSNLLYNSAILGPHGFAADMATGKFAGIVFTNTLAMVLTLGIFYPWAMVRTLRYKLEHLTLLARGSIDEFVADQEKKIGALGDEFSDFMDFDFGL